MPCPRCVVRPPAGWRRAIAPKMTASSDGTKVQNAGKPMMPRTRAAVPNPPPDDREERSAASNVNGAAQWAQWSAAVSYTHLTLPTN